MRYLTFGEWKKIMIPVEPDCNVLVFLHRGDGSIVNKVLPFNEDATCEYDNWLVTKAAYTKHGSIAFTLVPSVQVERRWIKNRRNLSEEKRDINYTTLILAIKRFIFGF